MPTRDGIEWPAKDLTWKRKIQLIWRVVKGCVMNTLKTNDWLAIYEILLDACERETAKMDEDRLAKRVRGKE